MALRKRCSHCRNRFIFSIKHADPHVGLVALAPIHCRQCEQCGQERNVDDEFLVYELEKGGVTGRSLAFGVAKQHLEKGERKLAADWLDKAFYMLPKEDQVEMLILIIGLCPEISLPAALPIQPRSALVQFLRRLIG
jgi:hypothetical protein